MSYKDDEHPRTDETGDIDLDLLEATLKMSYAERVEQNYRARIFVSKLAAAARNASATRTHSMTDPLINLLSRLSDNGVDYVLIGGMAAILHGANVVTRDVDVVTSMELKNLLRIEAALRPVRPCWRMRPDRLPLDRDEAALRGLKNLYLETDEGIIDILGELPDVCTFEELAGRTQMIEVEGLKIRMLDIDTLIAAKRAASRPRDFQAVRFLEEIKKSRSTSN